jgi:hypothetical protein
LQVDEVIRYPYNEVYTVEVLLARIGLLSATFQVEVRPDTAGPVKWQILYAGRPHEGIMLGEKGELESKIEGR